MYTCNWYPSHLLSNIFCLKSSYLKSGPSSGKLEHLMVITICVTRLHYYSLCNDCIEGDFSLTLMTRLQRPSHVLHFYNAHPESTAETIKQVIKIFLSDCSS